ncbi:mCG127635, isoform CRA_b, partial [Mus musculus]
GVSRRNPGEEVPTLRSEVFLPLPLLPTSCRLPRPAGPRMELRRGGVGNQAAGRRMDGDCRDGGCGSKDAGSEDYENLPTSASVSTHMTAGAMAGILEHSIMYPVDSVKTRMQSLNPDPKARYTSIYGALKRIMHTEGFWRPLRGLNVMMMGAGPAHAMYFACYENMKRTLNDVFSHQGNSHLANGILKAFVWSWEALLSGASSPGPSNLHPRQTENSRVT